MTLAQDSHLLLKQTLRLNLPRFRRVERFTHYNETLNIPHQPLFLLEVCSRASVTPLVASPAPTLTRIRAAKRSHYLPSEQRCPTMPPHIPCVCAHP